MQRRRNENPSHADIRKAGHVLGAPQATGSIRCCAWCPLPCSRQPIEIRTSSGAYPCQGHHDDGIRPEQRIIPMARGPTNRSPRKSSDNTTSPASCFRSWVST